MNSLLKYSVPFSYFFFTRIKSLYGLIFLISFEVIPNILILLFIVHFPFIEGIQKYILCYLAFISFYELGYITNDIYSYRKEKDGRKRLGDFEPGKMQVTIMIMLRLFLFLGITFFAGFNIEVKWWVFYGFLGIAFFLHNILKNKELKVITFINLAAFRFLAPSFIFLKEDELIRLLPSIFLFYVFYRTLSYMESKDLLRMESKQSDTFRIGYFGFVLIISLALYFLSRDIFFVIANIYFLFWVTGFYLLKKIKPI